MNRRFWALLSLILALMLVPYASGAESFPSMSEIDDQIDKYFKLSKTAGGSIVILSHGVTVYQRDFGYANKSQKIPVTEDTYFRIASVTKMVSAIGIMQLVEQGLLDLDQDISTYFGYEIANPYYPKIPITLRQSMSHTTSLSQRGGYGRLSNTIHDMLSVKIKRPSNFTKDRPGSTYAYSNFGAGLMGSAMEAVTDVSVNQYMTGNVFAPLGIDAAYNAGLLQEPDNVCSVYRDGKIMKSASRYLKDVYEDFADPETHYRITVGDVFIRSRDLAKLVAILCGDGSYQGIRLLSPETVELMRADQRSLQSSVTGFSPYGLCVNREDSLLKDKMIYGHQGMASGAACNAYYDPDTQFVFVMLTNGCSQVMQDHIVVLARRMFGYTYSLFSGE